jgi:hypothetical protein
MSMTDTASSTPANDGIITPATDPADVQLVKYEAAKQAVIAALTETTDLEEACGIRNQAILIKKLAQLKDDRALIDTATEIRLRAQRRIGQLLKEMAERGEREVRGGNRISKSHSATLKSKTLKDLGLNKSQSSRCQKVADLSEEDFEGIVEDTKARAAGGRAARLVSATATVLTFASQICTTRAVQTNRRKLTSQQVMETCAERAAIQ